MPAKKLLFASDVSTTQIRWQISIHVASDDRPQFLVIEFRSSTSQRFGSDSSVMRATSRRFIPSQRLGARPIPLRSFRQGLGDADELASTANQPRNSY
jgi:hypothetical protein